MAGDFQQIDLAYTPLLITHLPIDLAGKPSIGSVQIVFVLSVKRIDIARNTENANRFVVVVSGSDNLVHLYAQVSSLVSLEKFRLFEFKTFYFTLRSARWRYSIRRDWRQYD